MSRNKKDIFKEVISQAETQKPVDDMAGLVMQQITADAQDEVAINATLKNLLQQHTTDAAPLGLTQKVMAQINPQPAETKYAPLISKKAWYGAAAVLAVLMLISAWGGPAGHTSSRFVNITVKQVNALPSVYIITLTFCGLLMVLDYLITNRVKLNKL